MKYKTAIHILLLSLIAIKLSFPVHAQEDDDALTSEHNIFPENQDELIGFGSGATVDTYGLPERAFSGPGNQDIGLYLGYQIIGSPVMNSLTRTFDRESAPYGMSGEDGGQITVVTYLAALTVGLAAFFASIMMMFGLFQGLMYTGRDGKLLGEQWQSKMLPFRLFITAPMLVPIPGFGGLCGIQVVVLSFGLLGIGIASTINQLGAEYLISGGQAAVQRDGGVDLLSENIIEAAMCASAAKYATQDEDNSLNWYGESSDSLGQWGDIILVSGDRGGAFYDRYKIMDGACGDYNLRKTANIEYTEPVIEEIHQAINQRFRDEIVNYYNAVRAIADRYPSINEYLTNHGSYPSEALEGGSSDGESVAGFYADLNIERNNFLNAINGPFDVDVQSRLLASSRAFVDEVSRYGFMMMHTYYYELNRRQGLVSGAISMNVPEMSVGWGWSIECSWFVFGCDDSAGEIAQAKAAKVLAEYSSREGLNFLAEVDNRAAEGRLTSDALNDVVFGGLSSGLTEAVRTINQGINHTGQVDPIAEVKLVGDLTVTVIELSITRIALAVGAAEALSALPVGMGAVGAGASGVMSVFLQFGVSGISALYAMGFLYAYLIPAIPSVMMTVAVMGFMVYWIQCLFYSPLGWALHVSIKGDDLTGKAEHMYPILVNLVLRPTFIVAGFYVGMGLMKVMGWYLDVTVFAALEDAAAITNANAALSSIAGSLFVYGMLTLFIIYKSFSLAFEFPNAMAKFLNADTSQDFGENEAKTQILGGGAVATKMADGASGAISGQVRKMQEESRRQNANNSPGAGKGKSAETVRKTEQPLEKINQQ